MRNRWSIELGSDGFEPWWLKFCCADDDDDGGGDGGGDDDGGADDAASSADPSSAGNQGDHPGKDDDAGPSDTSANDSPGGQTGDDQGPDNTGDKATFGGDAKDTANYGGGPAGGVGGGTFGGDARDTANYGGGPGGGGVDNTGVGGGTFGGDARDTANYGGEGGAFGTGGDTATTGTPGDTTGIGTPGGDTSPAATQTGDQSQTGTPVSQTGAPAGITGGVSPDVAAALDNAPALGTPTTTPGSPSQAATALGLEGGLTPVSDLLSGQATPVAQALDQPGTPQAQTFDSQLQTLPGAFGNPNAFSGYNATGLPSQGVGAPTSPGMWDFGDPSFAPPNQQPNQDPNIAPPGVPANFGQQQPAAPAGGFNLASLLGISPAQAGDLQQATPAQQAQGLQDALNQAPLTGAQLQTLAQGQQATNYPTSADMATNAPTAAQAGLVGTPGGFPAAAAPDTSGLSTVSVPPSDFGQFQFPAAGTQNPGTVAEPVDLGIQPNQPQSVSLDPASTLTTAAPLSAGVAAADTTPVTTQTVTSAPVKDLGTTAIPATSGFNAPDTTVAGPAPAPAPGPAPDIVSNPPGPATPPDVQKALNEPDATPAPDNAPAADNAGAPQVTAGASTGPTGPMLSAASLIAPITSDGVGGPTLGPIQPDSQPIPTPTFPFQADGPNFNPESGLFGFPGTPGGAVPPSNQLPGGVGGPILGPINPDSLPADANQNANEGLYAALNNAVDTVPDSASFTPGG